MSGWDRKRLFALLASSLALVGASKPPLQSKHTAPASRPAPPKTSEERKTGPARIIFLSDHDVGTIYIHPGGSVLSFPAKPSKVVIGREGQFDIQYIEHDVAIVALTPSSKASMFVYLLGRRFTFNLIVQEGLGERIIMIRDPSDDKVEIEVK